MADNGLLRSEALPGGFGSLFDVLMSRG
ncbi:protein of unknown function [Nitratireductor aquimarinus]